MLIEYLLNSALFPLLLISDRWICPDLICLWFGVSKFDKPERRGKSHLSLLGWGVWKGDSRSCYLLSDFRANRQTTVKLVLDENNAIFFFFNYHTVRKGYFHVLATLYTSRASFTIRLAYIQHSNQIHCSLKKKIAVAHFFFSWSDKKVNLIDR